ncbi:RluA family pseudouridine synthase [Candidatus Saccharibacteria bacterium QS_5_54_17]|nr:MAG: RluA family pseudouridine synthase [Candidatus Saccharibacteria bacterium QS_5_54_17]
MLGEKQQIAILSQDGYLLVIDKPAGIAMHPGNGSGDEETVVDHLGSEVSDWDSQRPGIVHRLDKHTSGVVVIAKDAGTKALLQRQFKSRQVEKHYIAGVQGIPDRERARIEVPIGARPKNPLKRAVRPDGKPAVTQYHLTHQAEDWSLLDVYPLTGRTHQIRVHLSYIGHPVLGDSVYGVSCPGLAQHFLHAKELTILHPATQQPVTYTAQLPPELDKKIARLNSG